MSLLPERSSRGWFKGGSSTSTLCTQAAVTGRLEAESTESQPRARSAYSSSSSPGRCRSIAQVCSATTFISCHLITLSCVRGLWAAARKASRRLSADFKSALRKSTSFLRASSPSSSIDLSTRTSSRCSAKSKSTCADSTPPWLSNNPR